MKRFEQDKINGLEMRLTEQELDKRLDSAGQQQVRTMLQAMPEEPLSLSWRSELNQVLAAKRDSKIRRRRIAWFLSPALGLGVAGALAVVTMFKTPEVRTSQISGDTIEAQLVASHRNSIRIADVTGVGLNSYEVIEGKNTSTVTPGSDLDGVDFGSL
ncbi:MAG: hypothetical protein BGO01_14300 [Armatimonadetes bacterium 55-13]|nr:hypothetical protein [Armatimonadota bacterium]OJU64890.1 MAG: hypothetical protein BGO01_14300 [Armatimonadetes bacterium 55-13]